MALADSPPATADTSNEQRSTRTTGTKRWSNVVALWAAAVGTQALILFALDQYGNSVIKSSKLGGIASLLADGRVKDAKIAASRDFESMFPTDLLVHFALLGVAVIVLAWVGRRPLALALPFFLGIVSMSPTFSDVGSMTPKPISEFDGSLWEGLQLGPTGSVIPQDWPSLLGLVVQTGLLLLPLIAAPHLRAATSLASAARAAALPTLAVMALALAALEYSAAAELYRMPVIAVTIGFTCGAIATGTRSAWVRLPAAVGVPTILAATLTPNGYSSNPLLDSTAAREVAVAALLITLGTIAIPWARSRLRNLQQRRVPNIPAPA